MHPELEIILPTHNPGDSLIATAASLAAQTDRQFGVVLCDNHSTSGLAHLEAAQKQLTEAGISVQRIRPSAQLKPVEHWNWAHAQARGAWLKPLFPGERLKPNFVEHLKRRIHEKPNAQIIRCDLELHTEWGVEKETAPFTAGSLNRAEVLNYFPAHSYWLAHSANFAYGRTAWLALGGYAPHLPASAALILNVMLALHHGLENLPELLAEVDIAEKTVCSRQNRTMEFWLILLQARNYCLAAKLPWTERFLFLKSLAASLRRW